VPAEKLSRRGYKVRSELGRVWKRQIVNNEVTEIAKATQEVAKTARTGIEAAQGLGSFLAKVLGEPIETAVGLVSDKLKFVRFERQMRLADRYSEVMVRRGLSSEEQPVPPKIALPAIENASLEEDDELQDLWANLLASSHDKTLNGVVRWLRRYHQAA